MRQIPTMCKRHMVVEGIIEMLGHEAPYRYSREVG